MNNIIFPNTGEQALNGWIFAIIVISAVLLAVSLLYPVILKLVKKQKDKKDKSHENLD